MPAFHFEAQEGGPGKRSSNLQSMCKCLVSSSFSFMIHLPIVNYVFYAERSLIWRFSALKPNSKLTLLGEHSFQVNIQVLLPDVQLTKSITTEYFCPVLPRADHYYTQGSLTSQWKLVKIIGYFYLNTGRKAKLFFFLFFLAQIDDYRRCL